jgi:hypothetical protein
VSEPMPEKPQVAPVVVPPEMLDFYRRGMAVLERAGVRFLVGGAYAFERYTGIARYTKDFDIFVHASEANRALQALAAAGCRTEMTFPHWLGKAWSASGEDFIDVIFSSGSGIAVVDEAWFEHSVPGEVFGVAVRLIPAEEMIWSKAFVMERERYDGADVLHVIRCRAAELDWQRLVARFGRFWRVLFGYLVLFGFVYPAERTRIPAQVIEELTGRLHEEAGNDESRQRVCQGTLLSRAQYLVDVSAWGYRDGRTQPDVRMSEEDIAHWTRAIGTIP